jgi:hypothetical protein
MAWFLLSHLLKKRMVDLNRKGYRMPHRRPLLWMFGLMIFIGMTSLALPLPAHAGGLHVSIGLGVPVYPAPIVVAPPPAVVYPAPVIVTQPPVVYGAPSVVVGGYHGPRHRHWRHHHHHWRRW